MRRLFERVTIVFLASLIALYAGDWLIYRYRATHGSAFSTVKINEFMAVPLKNGKEELDYISSGHMQCVRALFPWAGNEPCWWVKKHAEKRLHA
jgi:hypothetical protein